MLRKEHIFGVLFVLLTFGMATTVFAGESDYRGVLGSDTFSFERMDTGGDTAAMNHNYDQDHLARVGTEAGNWEYSFDDSATKTEIAAKKHDYNEKIQDQIGTEAGVRDSASRTLCANC